MDTQLRPLSEMTHWRRFSHAYRAGISSPAADLVLGNMELKIRITGNNFPLVMLATCSSYAAH